MDAPTSPAASRSGSDIQRQAPWRDFARLGFKAGALLTAVMATVAGIVYFVPDDDDYALATLLKHKRLALYDTRKIVLIGGSNLAYGIDSRMIERATGCPVVNMGMNGYLGVRYMLEEVKPYLNPSDVVVLAFEWDNYYKSVDGTAPDLLAMAKTNPTALNYLSLKQTLRVIAAIPSVAQQKAMRLISEAIVLVKNRVTGSTDEGQSEEDRLIERVESRTGFTRKGDLVSHLGVSWPYPREDGIIPKGAPIESRMISLMRDFASEMTKRDVAVMVSYTPVIRAFYDRHQNDLGDAHKLIRATPPLVAPSPPSAFVYDEGYFFDTVYHLNAEGRRLRTQKLIQDLETQWHERVHCPTVSAAAAGE